MTERRRDLSSRSRWEVIGAQVVGQLALVAVTPALTRLVPAGELGAYYLAFAMCLLAQPLATLRTEFAIPSIRHDSEFRRVSRVGWTCCISGTTGFTIAGAVLIGMGADEAGNLLLPIALLLLAYGGTSLDNAVLIRRGQTRRLAVRNLVAGLAGASLQLAAAVYIPNPLTLAASILVGRGFAILLTHNYSPALSNSPQALIRTSPREWTITRGLTAVLSGVVSAGALQAMVVLASIVAGARPAAMVGIAQRSAAAPLGLLSQGISQALQTELSALIRSKDPALGSTLRRRARGLAPVALLLTAVLGIGGPFLAGPVFGNQWTGVGTIIAVLAIPSGLQLLVAPLTVVYLMIGRESTLLVQQVCWLAAALSASTATYYVTDNFIWSIAAYAAASSVFYVGSYLVLIRVVDSMHDPISDR